MLSDVLPYLACPHCAAPSPAAPSPAGPSPAGRSPAAPSPAGSSPTTSSPTTSSPAVSQPAASPPGVAAGQNCRCEPIDSKQGVPHGGNEHARPEPFASALTLAGNQLRCPSGHTFDIARQGYVNLLSGEASVHGDTADMVAARAAFLSAGHYRPVTDAIIAAITATPTDTAANPTGCLADLGAGTGHYLATALDARPDLVGLALEISKPALRRLARVHPRAGAVGCDVWAALPIRDAAISVALNVFAPRNPSELARVVAPGGTLVVVTPTARHLAGLITDLGLLSVPPDKERQVTAALTPHFEPSTQDIREFELELSHDDVLSLVGMGPSAWHIGAAALRNRVTTLPEPVRVTASVLVATYRRT